MFLLVFFTSTLIFIIPNTNEVVPVNEYMNNIELVDISISEGIKIISLASFANCPNLKSVSFPRSLTQIKESAFSNCNKLSAIDLSGTNIEKIENYAFKACVAVKSIKLPATFNSLGSSVFRTMAVPLNSISIDSKNPAFCYKGGAIYTKDEKGLIFVFDEIDDNPTFSDKVEYIGSEAICACDKIITLRLPPNLLFLNRFMAISGCNNLATLEIGAKVTQISSQALLNLPKLTNLLIDPSNTNYEIKDSVLFTKGLVNLLYYPVGKPDKEYTIPKNTQMIDATVFLNVVNNEKFSVEAGSIYLKAIDGVVYSFDETILVKWPISKHFTFILDTVTEIETGAFYSCQKVRNFTFPPKLKKINSVILKTCTIDNTLILPESCTDLAVGCLQYVYVKKIVLSKRIKYLPASSITGSTIQSIELPEDLEEFGSSAFEKCKFLRTIDLPECLRIIGDNAFKNCNSLKEITFPNKLERIGSSAFEACDFSFVEIPHSTLLVKSHAFSTCTKITSAVFLNCDTVIEKDAFIGCTGLNKTVCVATKYFTSHRQADRVFLYMKFIFPYFFLFD